MAVVMAMRMPIGTRKVRDGAAGLFRLVRVPMIGVQVRLRHAAASAAGGWFLPIDRIWCATAPRHDENRIKGWMKTLMKP